MKGEENATISLKQRGNISYIYICDCVCISAGHQANLYIENENQNVL